MIKLTRIWWEKCLNDEIKLQHWLVSLYNNEKDAEERFIKFADDYCKENITAREIFIEIAAQEANHAKLVEEVLKDRGISLFDKTTNNGRYWRNTLPCIIDLETAAAIGAYAEGLSLSRMRVIIKDTNTPEDLRLLFKIIEPEEAMHAKKLKDLASTYGMKSVKGCHEKGLHELGLMILK